MVSAVLSMRDLSKPVWKPKFLRLQVRVATANHVNTNLFRKMNCDGLKVNKLLQQANRFVFLRLYIWLCVYCDLWFFFSGKEQLCCLAAACIRSAMRSSFFFLFRSILRRVQLDSAHACVSQAFVSESRRGKCWGIMAAASFAKKTGALHILKII